jgi:hypothetical protein
VHEAISHSTARRRRQGGRRGRSATVCLGQGPSTERGLYKYSLRRGPRLRPCHRHVAVLSSDLLSNGRSGAAIDSMNQSLRSEDVWVLILFCMDRDASTWEDEASWLSRGALGVLAAGVQGTEKACSSAIGCNNVWTQCVIAVCDHWYVSPSRQKICISLPLLCGTITHNHRSIFSALMIPLRGLLPCVTATRGTIGQASA